MRSPNRSRSSSRRFLLALSTLALLSVASLHCAHVAVRSGCVEQNEEVLEHIIACADPATCEIPEAVDLWMREVARACGWISEED